MQFKSLLFSIIFASSNAKKILLCFDGTGNSPIDNFPDPIRDYSFTNVLKMHLLAGGSIEKKDKEIKDAFEPDQISLYEKGVGTRTMLASINYFLGDLRFQTRPMKRKLEKVYKPGDELYLIGFSRGASSARQFASDLYQDGIETKDGHFRQPPIKFLGCFDTVSTQIGRNAFSLASRKLRKGIPHSKAIGEADGKVAPNVEFAVHNVALDDHRMWTNGNSYFGSFPPTLMGAEDRVHEVWFPGNHGDVGGNYYNDGLSDGSLKYMQEWMESLGFQFRSASQIEPESLSIRDHSKDVELQAKWTDIEIIPNALDDIHFYHNEKYKSTRPIYTVSDNKKVDHGLVRIHESVVQRLEEGEYDVNENLKDTKFEVVTSLGRVLEDKTQKLVELLNMKN